MKHQNTSNTPGIAVIGSGYWGKNLVRNFSELGALKMICDKDEEVLSNFRQTYKGINTSIALSDVLACEDIQGIVIATPAETHFSIAREAMLAGKHVFVEKPLALTQEEGQELIQIHEKTRKNLMVGHLLQYHPVFLKIKELIAAGELGRINYIYSHRLNLGKFRREENILWSFAPHDISMILAIAGERPESVTTIGCNYLHQKIADVTTTHLEFASGIRTHVFVSWLHPFKEQKLVVVGDKKMAVFDDTQPWPEKLVLYPHTIRWENNIPVASRANAERQNIAAQEPLKLECQHFLDSITKGHAVRTNAYEGFNVLAVLNASQKSMDQGGIKVRLPEMAPQSLLDGNPGSQGRGFSPVIISGSETKAKAGDNFFAHPTAIVDPNCSIGENTRIWHFSHVLSGSIIGRDCNIGQNVSIGPDVTIGSGCKIQNNVSIYKGVTLADDVFCGPSMTFTNVYNPRAAIKKMDQVRSTRVGKGASFGANCTIVCGIEIGRYAFVGAGALVNKDVCDHAIVVGNPARQIGWACQCGERLTEDLVCRDCNLTYKTCENGLELITAAETVKQEAK